MTRLIIVRHGNTFASDEPPRRIGARTDIPLVESGQRQAQALGVYLAEHKLHPDIVFTSPLKRAQETAELMIAQMGLNLHPQISDIFAEIDHGPDENQTEERVVQRIGAEALQVWDQQAIPPEGWQVDQQEMINNWQRFADNMLSEYPEQTVMVVTSGGTARFALYLTDDFAAASQKFGLKLSTGAFGMLNFYNHRWVVEAWNKRP